MKITLELSDIDEHFFKNYMCLTPEQLGKALMKELAQTHNTRRIDLIDTMKSRDLYPSIPYTHTWSLTE